MTIATIRRRLNAIANSMRPTPYSLDGRISRLSENDQAAYRFFVDQQNLWVTRHPAQNQYQAILNGDIPPFLPNWLSEKIGGFSPVVSDDLTTDQLQMIYHRMVFGEQS